MLKEKILNGTGKLILSAQLKNQGLKQKEIDFIMRTITVKNKLMRLHSDINREYGYTGVKQILKATNNLISDIETIRESEEIIVFFEGVSSSDFKKAKQPQFIVKYLANKKNNKLNNIDIIAINTLIGLGIGEINIFKNQYALQASMDLVKSIHKTAHAITR